MVRLGLVLSHWWGMWPNRRFFPPLILIYRWTPLNQKRPLSRRSLVAPLGHMKYMVPRARLSLFVVTSNGLVPRFFSSRV